MKNEVMSIKSNRNFIQMLIVFLIISIISINFISCSSFNIELKHKPFSQSEEEFFFDALESSQNLLHQSKNSLKSYNKNFEFQPRFSTKNKKNKVKSQLELSTARALESVLLKLTNYKNSQYVGTIQVGTPKQEIDVIFDTGSSNFWITSVNCMDPGCLMQKSYNNKLSSTHSPVDLRVEVEFGSGKIEGVFSKDTVYFGPLKIENQEFGEIEKEEGDIFTKLKFSGILGLSFPKLSSLQYVPILDTIIQNKHLKHNWFSFYITDRDEDVKSQIILGEPSPNLYEGEMFWLPVSEESYWQVEMDDILINGQKSNLCHGNCKLVIDTGTSIMTGPPDDLKYLLNMLPLNSCENVEENLPVIGFSVGEKILEMKPSEYVLFSHHTKYAFVETENKVMKVKNTNKLREKSELLTFTDFSSSDHSTEKKSNKKSRSCKRAFMPLDVPPPRGPLWVLGDIFLRKYFVIFDRDQKRMGFALRRKNINLSK